MNSAKSTDLPSETDRSKSEEIHNQIMAQITEFCRLFTMEMKCHITPVFGCFEFLECSFIVDSEYNLKFRTVDSSPSIFTNSISCGGPKTCKSLKNEETKKSQNKKIIPKFIHSLIAEGIEIVLELHQYEWIRVKKETFSAMLENIKNEKKYSFQYLYTDFE